MKIPISILLTLLLFSCRKDPGNIDDLQSDDPKIVDGLYLGEYRAIYFIDGDTNDFHTNSVSVEFNDSSYLSSSSPDYYPAGGSGWYEMNGYLINFHDSNIWTANFDWNSILNDTYNFELTSDSLIMVRTTNPTGLISGPYYENKYEYHLAKQ